MIGAFLDHLEVERGNTPRTRNARLAAIHSLYKYAAFRHPEHAQTIARGIEIPAKRHARATISYLDLDEIKALLAAPDRSSWLGRRDHAMLLTAIQTGARVSELVALHVGDVSLSTGAHLKIIGKGRKQRSATLTPETVAVLREWMRERDGHAHEPLFPTRRGGPLTTRAVALLLDKHVAAAAHQCPSLVGKRVTPQVLRHTNAMLLRAQDVDILTIALWLGHENTKSTEIYLHADDKLKQQAIDRPTPTGTPPGRYQPPDTLLAFLERPDRSRFHRWFTDPSERAMHAPEEHERLSRSYVAALRIATARHPDDTRGRALVDRLLQASPEFAILWADHDVSWRPGVEPKTFQHPQVGRLELDCQTLIAESESQILLVYTATPGTESAERLRLLGVVGGQTFADSPAWDRLSPT